MSADPTSDPTTAGTMPWETSFFRRVRHNDAMHRHLPRTGFAVTPRDEALRFRQIVHMIFAPATLGSLDKELPSGANAEDVAVYFMGLLGPSGPMPQIVTDVVLARAHGNVHPELRRATATGDSNYRQDPGPAAFFDIFNHRFIALFYRAWSASRKAVDFDREDESRFRHLVGSLQGLGMSALQRRMELPDEEALYFSQHFVNCTRHPSGLEAVLSDFFGCPAVIEENVGHWVEVPPDCHTRLGRLAGAAGLGQGMVLGSRVWDRTMRFRIKLGPMSLTAYRHFFPGDRRVSALRSLVRLYVGHEFSCEVRVVLRREDVPPAKLDGQVGIGLCAWLTTRRMDRDPDDLRILID